MSNLHKRTRPRGRLPRRPPVAQQRIVGDIRGRILSGELGRRCQLPPRAELTGIYDVPMATIQRAMDWLAQDGFIQANASGTYVCDTLPHEATFAMVLPAANYSETTGNRFWYALNVAMRQFNAHGPRRIRLYHLDRHASEEKDVGGYAELEHDVLCHCLGGVILVDADPVLAGTPVMQHKGTPKIAITGGGIGQDYSVLHLVHDAYEHQALDRFMAHGCKRLGMLTEGSNFEKFREPMAASVAAHGLDMPDRWVQAVSLQHTEFARHAMLLMMAHPEHRPDALLIDNDQFVEPATRALIELGVRIPDDLIVVAHCNFPCVTRSHVPAFRLGYDAREVIEACVQVFCNARAGEPMPAMLTIQARWEEEDD